MRIPDRQGWLELAQRIGAVLGIVALATLVAEFGFHLPAEAMDVLVQSNHWILRAFLGLLALRLIAAPQRLAYLGSHRLEYVLGCVVAALTLFGFVLGEDRLLRWTPALEDASGTVTRVYLGVTQGILGVFSFVSFARASAASNWSVQPARIVVLSFLSAIVVGAGLFLLPRASTHGLSVTDAFFTAASAVCVTGLSTINVATDLTFSGQVVLLALIQIGGLGIMTLAGCVVALFGGAFGMRQRFVLRDLVEPAGIQVAKQVLMRIALMTFILEAIGAAFLYWFWRDALPVPGERLWHSAFHAVSAFCNAGFSTLPEALMGTGFKDNAGGLLVVCGLVILGGTGYPALADLIGISGKGHLLHRRSLQTRIVLASHLSLFVLAWLVLAFIESPGLLTLKDQILMPLVQGVMPRTAGFQTVDLTLLQPASLLLIMLLMWVGGSPGSTAGGLKVTTVWVVAARLWTMVRGRGTIRIRGREIDDETGDRAMAVALLSMGIVCAGTLALSALEGLDLMRSCFEVISALSTVGLSLNVTTGLGTPAKWLLIALMFIGRLGILAVLWSVFYSESTERVRRPRENVSIF